MTNIQTRLPQRVPAAPEPFPALDYETASAATAEYRDMDGLYRELVASDRQPMMTPAEVTEKWGANYGFLMGEVVLPGRVNIMQDPGDPEYINDQAMRTLMVFDARESAHSAPHFIIASLTGLNQAAADMRRLGRLYSESGRDIQHLYEGESLRVGTERGRWLPRELEKHENGLRRHSRGGHQHRPVISAEQTTFYVDGNRQLIVRSEGYNPDTFIGYPNDAERRNQDFARDYEDRMRHELVAGRAARMAEVAGALTTHMAHPGMPTEHYPRHGSNLGVTVPHR